MPSATLLEPTQARAGDAVPLISVEDLRVEFATGRGVVKAVDGVSWSVRPGETMALVGESGCGKSVSALAVMRLLAKPAGRVAGGRIMFDGRDLLTLQESEMRELRGRDISMIFQEPMTSLNPILTIGLQIMEPLKIHLGMSDEQATARAVELLGLVGIPDAARRLGQFPHQFSGGMRQRVMIAIGLACNPKLIIADEPTTALDVTIQAQILELMKDLSRRLGITLVIITHNLGIVARYADRVAVMYAGRVVEEGPADRVFGAPRHPYTIGLMRSVPRLDRPRDYKLATIEGLPPNLLSPPSGCRFAARCPFRIEKCAIDPPYHDAGDGQRSACHRAEELAQGLAEATVAPLAEPLGRADTGPLLEVRGLTKHFEVRGRGLLGAKGLVRAVENVSFSIERGRTLGLVGESGCGKTTIGRTILRLEDATGGEVRFDGEDLVGASRSRMKELRTKIQVIFQDPYSSLNPRMSIGDIIAEPLVFRRSVPRRQAREQVAELLVQVGLYADMAERFPHQLSGGQRQRVGIARALAMDPSFIVCDEPVSALDVSIQGQIINLLDELQERLGLTYLFIAHDLAVVRHISHRIVVMYLGRVMEMADRDELYAAPLHPYTQALLDAAPVPDPVAERARQPRALTGELPSPLAPPSGCVFHTRCPLATAECRQAVPEVREVRPGHFAACIKI
ncbi:peptide/nickel transport system ATP-binding protein [Stella humosa]|uniref:Peptide/nickel transport system ATP-binding protein n=1 Tax=Stella humosa TaxID=94 RepID=A0A3N1M252_9PROT|nr:peptide/nickel transport system ATP-binding protein [Stella humosa]BBK30971.1 oligopeptide ABC transporter ATP-binding protein OppF [Stella humosa]